MLNSIVILHFEFVFFSKFHMSDMLWDTGRTSLLYAYFIWRPAGYFIWSEHRRRSAAGAGQPHSLRMNVPAVMLLIHLTHIHLKGKDPLMYSIGYFNYSSYSKQIQTFYFLFMCQHVWWTRISRNTKGQKNHYLLSLFTLLTAGLKPCAPLSNSLVCPAVIWDGLRCYSCRRGWKSLKQTASAHFSVSRMIWEKQNKHRP